jgi:hypothetical protein
MAGLRRISSVDDAGGKKRYSHSVEDQVDLHGVEEVIRGTGQDKLTAEASEVIVR